MGRTGEGGGFNPLGLRVPTPYLPGNTSPLRWEAETTPYRRHPFPPWVPTQWAHLYSVPLALCSTPTWLVLLLGRPACSLSGMIQTNRQACEQLAGATVRC